MIAKSEYQRDARPINSASRSRAAINDEAGKERHAIVWNMALVILTYLLAIFGKFLTRSGIITSVHAFA
jgi:hypothetical protein